MARSMLTVKTLRWVCPLVGCLLLLLGGHVAAKEVKLPELTKEERQLATNFIKGRQGDTAEARQALRKALYYELSRLTHNRELPNYGTIRQSIYATYLATYRPEAQAAREYAVRTIAEVASGLARGTDFTPQTRVNAVAILAELDDVPAYRDMPPRPSAYARNSLFGIAADENAPLYLRSIALYGLQRQMAVWWNLPDPWRAEVQPWDQDFKRELGTLLVKIVDSQPRNPLEEPAHTWMVRRAYDCLASIQNPAVVPSALQVVLNGKAPYSLRLTAAKYLSQIDSSKMNDQQKSDYFIGVAHLLRSALVGWYEYEDDKVKRVSGVVASSGYGMGGYGGPGMGPGMGGPGMGDSGYGGEGGYGDAGEGGYGNYGGGGPGGSSGSDARPKPKDKQTWDTLLARRRANEIAEAVRLCLDGIPAPEQKKPRLLGVPLKEAGLAADLQAKLDELIASVEEFQTAINDPNPITDVNSLLSVAELPIEDIMDLVLEIPGFSQKYPDLLKGDELATAQRMPQNGKGAAGGNNAPGSGGNAPQGGNGGQQGNPNGGNG